MEIKTPQTGSAFPEICIHKYGLTITRSEQLSGWTLELVQSALDVIERYCGDKLIVVPRPKISFVELADESPIQVS
jgi:hypothetical protein